MTTTIQDQWQRKKQTKQEKRASKKAKLDPESYKSALDVHREKELKRKRELESNVETSSDPDASATNRGQESKTLPNATKRARLGKGLEAPKDVLTPEEDAAIRQAKAAKRREKREHKKVKKQTQIEKKEAAKASRILKSHDKASADPSEPREDDDDSSDEEHENDGSAETQDVTNSHRLSRHQTKQAEEHMEEEEADGADGIELDGFEHIEADLDQGDANVSSTDSSPVRDLAFDVSTQPSSSSSISSVGPSLERVQHQLVDAKAEAGATPHDTATGRKTVATSLGDEYADDESAKPIRKAEKLPSIDNDILRQRLEARLAALRASRKADGPDGKPARNRQELIDARRQKEEKRKQHKKELRAQARKDTNEAETEAARLRGGSGSPLWSTPSLLSPREQQNNFSFGRVAFDDGQELASSLTGTIDTKKKKGPQDARTALEAARNKQQRLSGLDENKRKDIEEKDRWLNAKKRVQGERFKDDTSLLKKALKRQDKGKKKSEKEWTDRIEGVAKGKEMKQKRREENLAKRKDEKGQKGKKGKPSAASKPKRRPGFEGSLKIGSKRGP